MYRWPKATAPSPQWQPSWDGFGTAPQWNYDWYQNMWMSCPKCSKLVQYGSIYCPNCGEKIMQEVVEKDKEDQILEMLEEISA